MVYLRYSLGVLVLVRACSAMVKTTGIGVFLLGLACLLLPPALQAQPDPDSLLSTARRHHAAGDLQEALEFYAEALTLFRAEDNKAGAAICLNNSSVILHDQGKHREAYESAQDAVDLRRELGELTPINRSLTNAGRALRELGQLARADLIFREALELAGRAQNHRDQVINMINLAVLSQMEGRYGDALAWLEMGFDRVLESSAESWVDHQRIILLNNRGVVYERIGEFRKALADYEEIETMLGSASRAIPFLINAGTILRNLGDPSAALAKFSRAREILAEEKSYPALEANLLSNIGLTYHLNLGNNSEAEDLLAQAYSLAQESGDHQETMTIGNALARVQFAMGKTEDAARIFLEVLERLDLEAALEPAWEAHLGMARVFESRRDRAAALRALATAADLVEGNRLNLLPVFAPRRFLAGRIEVFALMADLLASSGRQEDIRAAVLAVERARARLILQRWTRRETPRQTSDTELQELIQISRAAAATYLHASPQSLRTWQDLDHIWQSRHAIALPTAMPKGVAFINYFLAGEHSRVFWFSASGAGTMKLPAEKEITLLAQAWGRGLAAGKEDDRGEQFFATILKPVLDQLDRTIHTLRIIPDGALWNIPLDALPIPDTAGGNRSVRVIERYEVSLRQHFTVESMVPGESVAAKGHYAFFGPPDAARISAGPSRTARLPSLPQAQLEAEALQRYLALPGSTVMGAESHEARLREAVSQPLALLHIATHAIANPLDGGLTGIIFARPPGSPPRNNDGFLSLPELLEIKMDVGATVLSACSGGVGERLPGEGLESLAAALLEAGSRTVIASLWDVDDLAARALMEQFYGRLGRGESMATALRQAKLALLASAGDLAQPRHWAGWILVGAADWQVKPASVWHGNKIWMAALAALVFLGSITGILGYRYRRQGIKVTA